MHSLGRGERYWNTWRDVNTGIRAIQRWAAQVVISIVSDWGETTHNGLLITRVEARRPGSDGPMRVEESLY